MEANNNPSIFDGLDVKRAADQAAKETAKSAGIPLTQLRRCCKRSMVMDYYRIAVKYHGLPDGQGSYWLEGWRKGYGR